jgi:hypothetical protein
MYALFYPERVGDFLYGLSQYHNKGYRVVICIAYMDFPRVLRFSSLAQEFHTKGKKTQSFPGNRAFNNINNDFIISFLKAVTIVFTPITPVNETSA